MATVDGKQRPLAWFLALTLAGLGLACTSTKAGGTSGKEPAGQGPCFSVRSVDSFSPVGDRFIFVRTQTDKCYLLTLDAVYPTLTSATGIAISGNYAWVCSDIAAMVKFRGFGGQAVARILTVESVASLDEARKLAAERTPPFQQKD